MDTNSIVVDEAAEVGELNRLFKIQHQACLDHPYPGYEERVENLNALKALVLKYQDEFIRAMSDDFGHRSRGDSGIGDMLTTIQGINYCLKNVKDWMKPSKRHVELVYKPAQNYVMYQPVGIVGLLGCWNYPILESFGHLAWVLAAGNRCIIKGSEFVPNTNRVSKEAIAEFFNESTLGFVEGEVEVAQAFTALRFNHILVTGSPNVGKLVMKAAAENLTPVTLELGGKSPLILDEEMDIKSAVSRFILGKTMNAGQTCVAPDYIFCPESRIAILIGEIQRRYSEMYPDFVNNQDWTSILDDRQYARINGLLEDAVSKGATALPLAKIDAETQKSRRKMPLTLLTGLTEDMEIMEEEIFGPILPILPYTDLDEVITYIQSKPRPLALYINSWNKPFQDKILERTHAGGVCINEATFHVAQDDLPFGGSGNSGMGKSHGKEGFLNFSNQKAVFNKGKPDLSEALFPPFGTRLHKLLAKFLIR
jgi:coniferyl-aldehyde dehydrogenase